MVRFPVVEVAAEVLPLQEEEERVNQEAFA